MKRRRVDVEIHAFGQIAIATKEGRFYALGLFVDAGSSALGGGRPGAIILRAGR